MADFRVFVCTLPQNAPYRLFVDWNNMAGLLQAIGIYATRFAGNRATDRRQGLPVILLRLPAFQSPVMRRINCAPFSFSHLWQFQ